jgi:hypothetical protein
MARNPFEWIGDEIVDPLVSPFTGGGDDGGASRRSQQQAADMWAAEFNRLSGYGGDYALGPGPGRGGRGGGQTHIRTPTIGGGGIPLPPEGGVGQVSSGITGPGATMPGTPGGAGFFGYQPLEGELLGVSQASQADPATMEAQRRALQAMSGYMDPSVTAADRALMQEMQLTAQRQAAAARGAAQQQAQMRGMGRGGLALAQGALANQAAANQGAANARSQTIAAQQRALQAIAGTGQMGAGMQAQHAQRGAAADRFNQANTAYRQGLRREGREARTQALGGATGQLGALSGLQQRQQENRAQQNQNLLSGALGIIGLGDD